MSHEMKTEIGAMSEGEYSLRGFPISQLISELDFVSVLWLTWVGEKPSENQRKLLDACLVACVDHGTEPPSASVARTVASCGKSLADSVAAGLLTLGPRHGNASGAASVWIREAVASGLSPDQVADHALQSKQRLSGLGHPEYDVDPRTEALFAVAKGLLGSVKHFEFALAVSKVMSEKKGRPLPLNVDGALGAIIADMDAPPELADAIFLVARSVGLITHAREEAAQSVSYRRG
jgi:citrate synthase